MQVSRREMMVGACGCSMAAMATSSCSVGGQATAGAVGAGSGSAAPRASGPSSARGERRDGSGLPDLHHIALVVADRDRSLAKLQETFGFGRSHVFDLRSPKARVSTGVTGFELKAGFVWMGNTLLEFLQPVDDRSPHATFLRERGEGMHHLGFLVRSIEHELAAMANANGGRRPSLLVDATDPEGVSWVYVDGEAANGAVVELIERSAQSEQFFETIYKATGGRMPA